MSFIKKMVGAQVAKMVHETNTATSQMRQTVGEVRQKKCGISSIKKWDFERKSLEKNVEKPWFYENRLQMVDVPHLC
jgi:nucleoside diphosphate kinase